MDDVSELTANPVPVSAKTDNLTLHMLMTGARSKTAPRESRAPPAQHHRPPPARNPAKKLLGLRSGSVHKSSYAHAQKMSESFDEEERAKINANAKKMPYDRQATYKTQNVDAVYHVERDQKDFSPLCLGKKPNSYMGAATPDVIAEKFIPEPAGKHGDF